MRADLAIFSWQGRADLLLKRAQNVGMTAQQHRQLSSTGRKGAAPTWMTWRRPLQLLHSQRCILNLHGTAHLTLRLGEGPSNCATPGLSGCHV